MPPATALMDDVVAEILLRLPPDDPGCLVRACLVSKPWRRLLTGNAFLRSYRKFHGAPPMLGFLHRLYDEDPCVARFVPPRRPSARHAPTAAAGTHSMPATAEPSSTIQNQNRSPLSSSSGTPSLTGTGGFPFPRPPSPGTRRCSAPWMAATTSTAMATTPSSWHSWAPTRRRGSGSRPRASTRRRRVHGAARALLSIRMLPSRCSQAPSREMQSTSSAIRAREFCNATLLARGSYR
ncbi:hypothetical protein ACQJBY_015751 [Aegilops geniculata]